MTFGEFANKSIKPLYVLSALLLVAVFIRLMFPFQPRIDITPENGPAKSAPFLSIPNIGPIAREQWITDTLRECLSFISTEMDERIDQCALLYFDVNSQNAYSKAIPRTSFAQYMEANPSAAAEVQAINREGPYLIFEGNSNGRPVWRYQTEIMTTLFANNQTSTQRWLLDLTMTFDTPDSLYFSGFRFTNFYLKERT